MKTIVNFETAKLLKDKGFKIPCGQFYTENILDDDEIIKNNLCQRRDFGIYAIEITNYNFSYEYAGEKVNKDCYSAPTIAETIMWLYEKHGIWIIVTPIPYSDTLTHWRWEYKSVNYATRNANWKKEQDYNSPTKAYQEAIIYALKSLIK